MSLSLLAGGGAECGPSNPLQGLSKRFDQDRGVQQDQFRTGVAGPSNQAFRTQAARGPDQDAAKFFSANAGVMPQSPLNSTYDVSALRAALPGPSSQVPMHQMSGPMASADWASDFATQQPGPSAAFQSAPVQNIAPQMVQNEVEGSMVQSPVTPVNMNWSYGMHQPFINHPAPGLLSHRLHQATNVAPQISWDQEFSSHEQELASTLTSSSSQAVAEQESQAITRPPEDMDELARTAGELLENMKDEQNPKFKQSQFFGLMQKLRDRDVVVRDNQVVENDGQTVASDVKGKGKARETVQQSTSSFTPVYQPPTFHTVTSSQAPMTMEPATYQADDTTSSTEQTSEDPNDAYFRQENAEYIEYWKSADSQQERQDSLDSSPAWWDRLQEDWDKFEATSTGIQKVDHYQFQDSNPYLQSTSTHHHMSHHGYSALYDSVLQLEAAVQRDMSNAAAWFELGVKQQENERESKALQALKRSIELDPTHLPAWLALAVSYTNEGNRNATYDSINEWVKRNKTYEAAVQEFNALHPENRTATLAENYGRMTDCLIAMARSNAVDAIDADIQIALAVLLNSSEDYEKAQDCFLAALSVRPEDWLLYNRVGATMANNGRAQDALEYYYRALELNPGYIRARFNLGISCINLRRYEEAAHHILDALVLQDNDGVKDAAGLNEKRGVTNSALWDSLKTTCMHMQRVDLATLCDRRDLEAFRLNFQMQ